MFTPLIPATHSAFFPFPREVLQGGDRSLIYWWSCQHVPQGTKAFLEFGERCWQLCSMQNVVHTHLSVQRRGMVLYFSPKNLPVLPSLFSSQLHALMNSMFTKIQNVQGWQWWQKWQNKQDSIFFCLLTCLCTAQNRLSLGTREQGTASQDQPV